MKKAVYPGSFDPITNGHLDIIKRALKVVDELVVVVAINPNKKYSFEVEERINMIKDAVKCYPNVSVDSSCGLVVNYAKAIGASALVRGLRAVSDFEYEFQLAAANNYINNEIEMIFFMAHSENNFISSSTVKELFFNGEDVSKLVPASVVKMLETKK